MKRLLKIIAIACIFAVLCSQLAFCRAEISAAAPPSHVSAQPLESRLPPIEYPQRDHNEYTLSHLKILEVYPDNYKESESIYDDLCILFRAEVIQDLLGILEPGTIVFAKLYPYSNSDNCTEVTFAAAKEYLAAIDSCFIYSWTYQSYGEETPFYNEDNEPLNTIVGTVLAAPYIKGGGFLPIVDDRVDTEILEEIWEFSLERYDKCIPRARNMDQLLTVLEGHIDHSYHEQQQQSRESYETTTTILAVAIAAVIGAVFLIGSLYHLIQKLRRRS